MPQLKDQDFAIRLGLAKAKFEQMRAATAKLEVSVAKRKLPVVKKQTGKLVTEADLTEMYLKLKVSKATRAQQDAERLARRLKRGRTPTRPLDTTDNDLAQIEAELNAAEGTVDEFKALLETFRREAVPEEDKQWIMTADMELELQLDYLTQVEQNLATVPNPTGASPSRLNRLREAHAGLGLPLPPASREPWRRGGRNKTPRRKPRNSTFRRNRKH
jgi:hypothetical protein